MTDRRQEITAFIGRHRKQLFNLCDELVAARSVNPPGRTVEAATVLKAFFEKNGLECSTYSNVPDKPNIVSSIEGNCLGRHLVLNGHLDTVSPGREDDWSVPLYKTSEKDGKIYGLGIGNMKAGIAALAMAYVWLAQNTEKWPGRISFTAVADETVFGPDGADWLLDQQPNLKGDAVICGEGPGDMGLAVAEKGLLWIELSAKAASAQGMLSEPSSSAVTKLVQAVSKIDQWNNTQIKLPEDLDLLKIHADIQGFRLSVNTGTISGGHFVSQSATNAVAEIDFRLPPGLTIQELKGWLRDLCKEVSGLSYRPIKGWEANWSSPENPLCAVAFSAISRISGKNPKLVVRLPASDASRWRARGVPAICYGPQPLLASGVDDFASFKDIETCAQVYALTAIDYLNLKTLRPNQRL